ncbi:MAG: hypothetical protein ACI4QT_03980 [Kiritimatiellia bacterium]
MTLKSSDRWFVCILPAILLAALFWFGFASPKRAHLSAAQAEIESLGGFERLVERNLFLQTEKDRHQNHASTQNRTSSFAPGMRTASPVLSLSAARNVFRQAGLQIAEESLRSNQTNRATEWSLSLVGEFPRLLDALNLLSGPDYPELSVIAVSWEELRAGSSAAVWQIRIVL